MKLSDVNPHIRYARVHHSHSDYSDKFRVCYDCRIFFFAHASGVVITEKNEYAISSGMVMYLPPETKYKFSFDEKKNFEIVAIDFDLVNEYSHIKSSLSTAYENNFVKERVPRYDIVRILSFPVVRHLPKISDLVYQCANNFLNKDMYYREKTSALVKLCIFELLKDDSGSHSKLCDKVVEYIHENYEDAQLSNEKIAENFGYHPYYLNSIIKEETSKSIHRHLMDYRVEIAKNYLLTTDYTIDHISWRSGFSSTSYFVKKFREKTGITPAKYRKSIIHL